MGKWKEPHELPGELEPTLETLQRFPVQQLPPEYILPPVIYFLLRGDKIVYVGKSVDLVRRVATHQADKVFDRVFYLPFWDNIENCKLIEYENAFIRMLRPKLNGMPMCTRSDEYVAKARRIVGEVERLEHARR